MYAILTCSSGCLYCRGYRSTVSSLFAGCVVVVGWSWCVTRGIQVRTYVTILICTSWSVKRDRLGMDSLDVIEDVIQRDRGWVEERRRTMRVGKRHNKRLRETNYTRGIVGVSNKIIIQSFWQIQRQSSCDSNDSSSIQWWEITKKFHGTVRQMQIRKIERQFSQVQ